MLLQQISFLSYISFWWHFWLGLGFSVALLFVSVDISRMNCSTYKSQWNKIVPDSHSSCLDKNKCTFSTTHWTFQFKSITKRNITLHKSLNWMFLITFLNRPHGFEILSYVRVRGLFKGQKWTYLLFYSSDHRRPCKACWADQAVRGTSEIPLLLCEWSPRTPCRKPQGSGSWLYKALGTWTSE